MGNLFLAAVVLFGSTPALADSFDPQTAYSKSEKDMDAGRFIEAADEASKVLASAERVLKPNDPLLLRIISRHAHYALGARRVSEVDNDLARLIGITPPNLIGLIETSNVLRELGRLDQALSTAQQAAKLAPQDPESLATVARAYQSLGRYDDAVHAFEDAIKTGHSDYSLTVELATTLRLAGRFAEAAHLYDQARKANVQQASNYYEVGYMRLYSGQAQSALDEFKEQVIARPNDPMAHHHYGSVLWQTGRREESKREFEEALRLHRLAGHKGGEDYTHTLDWLSMIASTEGRFKEAFDFAAEERRTCDPYSSRWALATQKMTGVYLRDNEEEKAMKLLNNSLAECDRSRACVGPILTVLWATRAKTAFHFGRHQAARKDLGRVSAEVKRRHFELPWGCDLEISSALDSVDLYEQMGLWREAEYAGRLGIDVPKCAPNSSSTAALHEALGRLYHHCGDREKAVREWRAALLSYQALLNHDEAARIEALLTAKDSSQRPETPCWLMGAP